MAGKERLQNVDLCLVLRDFQENLYRDRNLDLLDSIGAGVNTEFYRENMLFIRNENMVNSLVELMPNKSVFAGVWAPM